MKRFNVLLGVTGGEHKAGEKELMLRKILWEKHTAYMYQCAFIWTL